MKTLGSRNFICGKKYRNIVKKFVVAKVIKKIKLKKRLNLRVNKNQVIQSSYLEDFIEK